MSEDQRNFRATDMEETVKFRASTELSLKSIRECIDEIKQSFKDFKFGLGERVDKMDKKILEHDDRLARIETSLGMLVKASWIIASAAAGVVVLAFFKLILK